MESEPSQGVTLAVGALRAAIRADLGGSLAGLWQAGVPVLRSTEAVQLSGPRQSACFPLVPYSNRLGGCRFSWRGHDYQTQPNFEHSPHSLHGVGWRRPWAMASRTADALEMCLQHAPDADWPFAFEATQRISLTAQSIRWELQLVNTDVREQPVGLGWHPYFPKRDASRMHIDVDTRWAADATQLPTHPLPHGGIDGAVAALQLDHCFDGWRGAALVEDGCFSLRLTASTSRLVVFTPPTQPHFCVEPVSHVSNAIQAHDPLSQGLIALAPGQSLSAWMLLEIEGHG